ncbi:MAG: TonB family protein [Crocinitomicaceae bacterium]
MSWLNLTLISINLLFGYLVYLRMNHDGRNLAINRWYLMGFPIVSVALGMAYHYSGGSILNDLAIELPIIEINESSEAISTSTFSVNWMYWIYLGGIALSLLHLGWSLRKVIKPSDAKLLNRLGKQRIYLVSNSAYSYSHFNAIYISEYQLENVQFILDHELAHSRQKHSLDLIFVRVLRCLLWFHPVIYLWESRMKENHEYLADHACTSKEQNIKAYSYALLSSHLGVSIPDLANGFNRKSLLQKRIIQLTTKNTFSMKKVILIPVAIAGIVLTMSVQLTSNAEPVKEQPKAEIILGDMESQPEFKGGMTAMVTYIQENIQYPKGLANKNIEGKVYVKFVVSKTGKIEHVKLARASEYEAFNKEATRVISNMPDWKPGIKDGKAVSAEMTLPIQFALTK